MLKIKGKNEEKVDEIEMERWSKSIGIRINDETVATFFDDGKFIFHGQENDRYEGKWNE